jgi:hypothetical protein
MADNDQKEEEGGLYMIECSIEFIHLSIIRG